MPASELEMLMSRSPLTDPRSLVSSLAVPRVAAGDCVAGGLERGGSRRARSCPDASAVRSDRSITAPGPGRGGEPWRAGRRGAGRGLAPGRRPDASAGRRVTRRPTPCSRRSCRRRRPPTARSAPCPARRSPASASSPALAWGGRGLGRGLRRRRRPRHRARDRVLRRPRARRVRSPTSSTARGAWPPATRSKSPSASCSPASASFPPTPTSVSSSTISAPSTRSIPRAGRA